MAARASRASALAALVAAAGCCASPNVPVRSGQIEHVVLLWLREPGAHGVVDRIAETAAGFRSRIPGILDARIGPPLPSERAVVDDSFDLALVMRFADEQALSDYLVHPVHTAALEGLLTPNVERLLVYDVRVR